MAIESFVGPLTAGAISDWLSRCEEDFAAHVDANPSTSLTNKQKILRAMNPVSRANEDSKRISTWYTRNRRSLDNDDWGIFRDKASLYHWESAAKTPTIRGVPVLRNTSKSSRS